MPSNCKSRIFDVLSLMLSREKEGMQCLVEPKLRNHWAFRTPERGLDRRRTLLRVARPKHLSTRCVAGTSSFPLEPPTKYPTAKDVIPIATEPTPETPPLPGLPSGELKTLTFRDLDPRSPNCRWPGADTPIWSQFPAPTDDSADARAWQELRASIRAQGILQPPHVLTPSFLMSPASRWRRSRSCS